ncbi:MAG: type II secretion system protein GspC [Pseudomonadota bacterium]
MPGQWLNQASDGSRRLAAMLEGGWHSLAQPERAARLRRAVFALLLIWAVLGAVQLIWALVPGKPYEAPENMTIINPASAAQGAGDIQTVDIDALVSRHLFGKVEAEGAAERRRQQQEAQAAANRRAGIEKGARETRLDLRLVGVVASTDDGAGHAIIEHRKKQEVYAIDDKLPVSGRVILAKVMPQQVVLDNGGTYELLKLFERTGLEAQNPAPRQPVRRTQAKAAVPVSAGGSADALARDYRDRLYSNPQSLAEVVRIAAVREGGDLVGYRVAPGKNAEQFTQLGLREGDVVTSVNGITLDNPANTVKLYQAMRTAQEATFDIKRNGRPTRVSVNLAEPAQGQ